MSESIEEVEEQAIIIEDLEPVVEENFTSSKWWIWTLVGVMVVLLAVLAIRLKLHKKLIKKK